MNNAVNFQIVKQIYSILANTVFKNLTDPKLTTFFNLRFFFFLTILYNYVCGTINHSYHSFLTNVLYVYYMDTYYVDAP